MSDTIELLDAIGQDASLRHASADELALVLEQANASEALKAAVAGNRSQLAEELGYRLNQVPQVVNSPGHEEEPGEQEEPLPNRQPVPDKSRPLGK